MLTYSTEDVGPTDRIAYWREAVCDVFVAVDCQPSSLHGFRGRIATQPFSDCAISRIEAVPQVVERDRRLISRSDGDNLLIAISLDGGGIVLQDGREAVMAQGGLVLYDVTRPYKLLFNGPSTQLTLMVERARLRRYLGAPEQLTAIAIAGDTPLARLTRDFVGGLAALPDGTEKHVQDSLASQALALIALTVGQQTGAGIAPAASRSALLARVQAFIRTHSHKPDLSAGDVAHAFKLAPRTVRDLLAKHATTFGRTLLRERLTQCRATLMDHRQAARSISDVAFAAGFNDLSHFSRAYRKAYGETPRDTRRTHRPS